MDNLEQFKSYLLALVLGLVNDQSAVEVEARTDDLGILLTLHVAKQDMGYVIGKEGNIAKALRTIMRAAGAREKARVNMKIAEPDGSDRQLRDTLSNLTS